MKKKLYSNICLWCLAAITLCSCTNKDIQKTNPPAGDTENTNSGQSVSEGNAAPVNIKDIHTILAYIKNYDGQTLAFDEVEWVDFPSNRAEELTLSDPGGGFLVYNEAENIEKLPATSSCNYTVLDWTNNYEVKEITSDEFLSLFNERINMSIPYTLTIRENEIISVAEHYVP